MRSPIFIASAVLCLVGTGGAAQSLAAPRWENSAPSAFFLTLSLNSARPLENRHERLFHRILTATAWPGYGMWENDPSRLAPVQRCMLVTERAGFVLDIISTERGLRAHNYFVERDPMNTLFGKSNVLGVLGSMTAWEMGYSYASFQVPKLLQRARLRNTARVSAVLLNGILVEERLQASVCNLRLVREPWVPATASCEP